MFFKSYLTKVHTLVDINLYKLQLIYLHLCIYSNKHLKHQNQSLNQYHYLEYHLDSPLDFQLAYHQDFHLQNQQYFILIQNYQKNFHLNHLKNLILPQHYQNQNFIHILQEHSTLCKKKINFYIKTFIKYFILVQYISILTSITLITKRLLISIG